MKYFIRGYPTAIILDKNLNLKGKITGYSEAKTYKANIIKIMGKRNTELNPIISFMAKCLEKKLKVSTKNTNNLT